MNTIGLVVNSNKGNVAGAVGKLIHWLQERRVKVLFNEESANMMGCPELGIPTGELAAKCDCIMVWGGDGTLLNCARQTAPTGTPILGVNLGRIGFLTEVDIPDLTDKMQALIADQYTIEERMMLEATVLRHGQPVYKSICLNDAVVTKGAFLKMVHLNVRVDGELVGRFAGDGVIISSPTGSTAYSLSAGGPIITPAVKALLITPICPHSMANRPIIIHPENQVEIEILPTEGHVMLSLDGQPGFTVETYDRVLVKRSLINAKFVKISKTSFYQVLRDKLKEWQGY